MAFIRHYKVNLSSANPGEQLLFSVAVTFPAVPPCNSSPEPGPGGHAGTYLAPCRRGRQTSATCSGRAGWGRLPGGRAASGWQTAPHYRWGNWAWRRRCAGRRRTRSRCSWTSCRRIRRWHRRRGRTGSKLQRQQRARGRRGLWLHSAK